MFKDLLGGQKSKKSDICVSVTPRYGVLKIWALVAHETPAGRVQPERFTQAVLLWVVIPTCLSQKWALFP